MDAVANIPATTITNAPGTSGTSITVTTGTGANFPAAPFTAVIWPTNQLPTFFTAEIVRVTAVVSDTLTVVRLQDGFATLNITANAYKISQDIDKDLLRSLQVYSGNLPIGGSTGYTNIKVPATQAWRVSSDSFATFTSSASLTNVGLNSVLVDSTSTASGYPGNAFAVVAVTLITATGESLLSLANPGGTVSTTAGKGVSVTFGGTFPAGVTNVLIYMSDPVSNKYWIARQAAANGVTGNTFIGPCSIDPPPTTGSPVQYLSRSNASVTTSPGQTSILVGSAGDTAITVTQAVKAPVVSPSTATMPSSQAWTSVAFGTDTFAAGYGVALTTTAGTAAAATSNNGVNWSAKTLATSGSYYGVAYGNGYFVTPGFGASVTQVYSKQTGTWANGGALSGVANWRGAAFGQVNGTTPTFVVSAATGSVRPMWSTDNGTTWTASTGSASGNTGAVAYGNGKFLLCSSNSTSVHTSTDGKSWTLASLLDATMSGPLGIAYGNGRWVIVSGNNVVAVTLNDGASFNYVLPSNSAGLSSMTTFSNVAFGGGYFVINSSTSPYLLYSTDGYNWVPGISSASLAIQTSQAIAYSYSSQYWFALSATTGTTAYYWSAAQSSTQPGSHYTIQPTSYNATS